MTRHAPSVEVVEARASGHWYAHCGLCHVTEPVADGRLYGFRATVDEADADARGHRDEHHPGRPVFVDGLAFDLEGWRFTPPAEVEVDVDVDTLYSSPPACLHCGSVLGQNIDGSRFCPIGCSVP